MAMEYTEEQLNNFDKATIVQLFFVQQSQLQDIDWKLQLLLEQVAVSNNNRFGKSSEKLDTENQICFIEVDGMFSSTKQKQLLRSMNTLMKVEIEEHHVGVYKSKKDNHFKKADHQAYLLRNSLVSPSLLAGVWNAKYVNATSLYRQEQEFQRMGLNIDRADMAHWTILCAERYLSIFYDYLLQADELCKTLHNSLHLTIRHRLNAIIRQCCCHM